MTGSGITYPWRACVRSAVAGIFLFAVLYMLHGCSGSEMPGLPDSHAMRAPSSSTTSCIGMWRMTVDWESGSLDIAPLRGASKALNALNLIEPPPGVFLKVKPSTLVIDEENHEIHCDVIIKHPVQPMEGRFNGFDVKGIVFGPRVTNADGLTAYFNPDDFSGTPLGYVDGLLGVPDQTAHYSETFNGYKYFCDNLGIEESLEDFYSDADNVANRGIFTEGSTSRRHYDLAFGPNPTKFGVFNYAVYASHIWPQGNPPFGPEQFSVTAGNQAEPVFAQVTELYNTLVYNTDFNIGSGAIGLWIDVFDWLKPSEPNPVWIESPGVFPQIEASFVEEIGPFRTRYFVETDAAPTTVGQLDIIVTSEDETTYGEHYFGDLMGESHPLYDEFIVTKFIHRTTVVKYNLFPYVEPFDGFGPEWTLSSNWTLEGDNSLLNNQDDTDCYAAHISDAISPEIPVPESDEPLILMIYHAVDVEYDHDEMYVQVNGQTVEPSRGILYNDDDTPGWTGEMAPGWSAFELSTGFNGEWVTIRFISNADGTGQCQSSGYYGWQIYHVMLGFADSLDFPALIASIDGPNDVGDAGPHEFTADIFDYNTDDEYMYEWETGDDVPAMYDDGPGNVDGTIDITFPGNGNYTIDLRIGHVSGLFSTALAPLNVVYYDLPEHGVVEDFESPLGDEWQFNDLSQWHYGENWGRMMVLDKWALDADGDDDGCYEDNQFAEARWTVTIPVSGFAVLKLIHMINAENSPILPDYCFDGGIVAIDHNILMSSGMLSGWGNVYNDGYFLDNTGGYIAPAGTFCFSGTNPSLSTAFDSSILDISSYADGNEHVISLIFDSDGSNSCEGSGDYTSWSIDEVGVYWE